MTKHILISCGHVYDQMHEVGPLLEQHGVTWDLAEYEGQQLSEAELLDIIEAYDGILAGDDEITAAVLEKGAAARLAVVAKWGIGIDGIDTAAAERLGVTVVNTPGMFGDEIADYAFGYLISLHRHLHRLHAGVTQGGWPKLRGHSLRGRTLGIVGTGSSGGELARRAAVSGMDVIAYDVVPPDGRLVDETGLEAVDLESLWARADAISLHAPLTPATHHLIDRTSIDQMRDGVLLVNTARGGLVDEAALIEALRSGKVAGAALDVFEVEPLPGDSPLRHLDNVILGSHNASNTHEAVLRTTHQAVRNLLERLEVST